MMILVTPNEEVEEKQVVLRREIIHSKFKVQCDSKVRAKIRCLANGFVHMRHFDIDICWFFSILLLGLPFLNGFPNPLIVRFRSMFLLNQ